MIVMRYGRSLTRLSTAVMVAAALAVSGCGGGGTAPTPPGGTTATQDLKAAADTALKAADAAVKAVMDDSEDAKVTDADAKVAAAEAAVKKVPPAERGDLSQRLGKIEGSLTTRKSSRTAAMKVKADMMKKEAQAVHAGIAPYNSSDSNSKRDKRYAQFNDQGNSSLSATPDLSIEIGPAAAVRLKPDSATMVAALGGWTGSKWKLEKEGTTYEAWVYDNRYSAPGDRFRDAWSDEFNEDTGWLDGTGTASVGQHQKFEGVEIVSGNNRLAKVGEQYRVRGTFAGVPGEYHCTPALDKSCAVQPRSDGLRLGDLGTANFAVSSTIWRFRPDNMDDRVVTDPDPAFVTYGYWIKKGADGKWDVSAFHGNHRGATQTISGLTGDSSLSGKATYDGGAAGVYALSDGAGTFTADAGLVADFTGNSVTGTIDGFMTRGFTGGDGMSRDWSVDLRKLLFNAAGGFVPDASKDALGLTRWTMDGAAAPAAGKWEGSFYEQDGTASGNRPKAATGSFFAEHGTSGSRMVGAFGVKDPDRIEQ